MNTARMDSLLNRQKQNLVIDAVYALVVAIALVIYVLGLGIGTSPRTVQTSPNVPGMPSMSDAPVATSVAAGHTAQDTSCVTSC